MLEKPESPIVTGCGDKFEVDLGCLPDACVLKDERGNLVIKATRSQLAEFGIVVESNADTIV
jgi:RecJ-like exonuclease